MSWIDIAASVAAVLAAGLIAVMTGVNLLSVKTYGEFELWFASCLGCG